jgi:RNA polymerase sigma factor (TIGR02999 family)
MNAIIPSPGSPSGEAFELTYHVLRQHARHALRNERNAVSMSPTVLVHEAWIALAKSSGLEITDASHYVRLIGRVMRHLLIDHARRRRAVARGGELERVEWAEPESVPALRLDTETVLAVAHAMESLAAESPTLAELVELRYFAGFTESEAGKLLGLSGRSVRRQWNVARLRLMETLALDGKVQL